MGVFYEKSSGFVFLLTLVGGETSTIQFKFDFLRRIGALGYGIDYE